MMMEEADMRMVPKHVYLCNVRCLDIDQPSGFMPNTQNHNRDEGMQASLCLMAFPLHLIDTIWVVKGFLEVVFNASHRLSLTWLKLFVWGLWVGFLDSLSSLWWQMLRFIRWPNPRFSYAKRKVSRKCLTID
jgi:hypothetical protein